MYTKSDFKWARRQNDSDEFVTVCEARFISLSLDTLALVWACPANVPQPDNNTEDAICQLLIEKRLVDSCTLPNGGRIDLPPPDTLPPTR